MALVLTIVRHPRGAQIPSVSKIFTTDGGTIGRSPKNFLQLPDPQRFVSSMHGLIRCDGGIYFIVDTSTNGIFLNDSTKALGAGKKARLSQGDRLFIGEYELAVNFDVDDISEERAPVTDSIECRPLQDIDIHHRHAMIVAARAAFNHMMTRLSPETLLQDFRNDVEVDIAPDRKALHWEQYQTMFKDFFADMDETFKTLFAEKFVETYEEYVSAAELIAKK